MIVRLYATHCGLAQCLLDAVPEARVIPIHDVFRYADLARIIDGLAPHWKRHFWGRENQLFERGTVF